MKAKKISVGKDGKKIITEYNFVEGEQPTPGTPVKHEDLVNLIAYAKGKGWIP